jgi:thymidylate synthase
MYQRSSDLFLGLPFNIASTALLTHLIAHECNLAVGTMRIIIGDAHIYTQHIEAVQEQLGRIPKPLPKLSVVRDKDALWGLKEEDVTVLNYHPEPSIKAEMIA